MRAFQTSYDIQEARDRLPDHDQSSSFLSKNAAHLVTMTMNNDHNYRDGQNYESSQ